MSKMRKEYDPNKVKRRKRKPIVYIICEGKETETLYFKHFRSRNCLVDIIPIPSKHKAAEHLVKHAKSLISQADYYPKDGDQLWCVFDCDDNFGCVPVSNPADLSDDNALYDGAIYGSGRCFRWTI